MLAVLGTDREGFVCFTCKYARHSCTNVTEVKEMVANNDQSLPDFVFL